ncbi:purine nucleoside phosphorylase I, inosine and guanosine-specific [Petrotoga mobilis SJ95]|jgi:purine-nucleoside phosphorylase|uniref:Purine nucleoside phosphorylase n=1 Tax=Petrotoga mobilis (strain DSM 10674 / SJ95) TaxID=403833 RepID=A9BHW0_PETMO|nr:MULTISPECIES: purine-nucleoside phosphorylase [Petrotoga]MDK2812238.1 purine-nucleoside phosphorylase [Petrotoga sp.]ABX32075.1 purine nucleoside phosphorylase I, inosine and guanosine-specific [Petrotoga mobilis SJ95]PNR90039.1 purine nucleoside phosphorylase [Petrotoga sp. 9T1HF07.CasAA.8.2]RLL85340.1 purine nucleoside phosphorylase [Petrotoga sp. Shatin.DS.tank11.9.2.9.3]RLL88944.1 purine nucleoside phosphorylase [Petrotoga sp. HKA.pet.4.5]
MDIEQYVSKVREAAKYIQEKTTKKPRIAIVLGSGLGKISQNLEDALAIPYSDIPNFPRSTAPGHKGELMIGSLKGKDTLLMNGRFHYYEGYTMKEVTFPIRVMQELGIETLVLTNAAGTLNPDFEVGVPCIITDHINFFGDNPLIGPNFDDWGPRFPDMTEVYSKSLVQEAFKSAKKLNIRVYSGVYLGLSGPTFETPAEMAMMRNFGADLVGMSTVPEAIVAKHAGMEILGITAITDKAVPEQLKEVSAEEVLKIAEKTGENIAEIIMDLVDIF